MSIVLGIDLDNTLINYDGVLYKRALHLGQIISDELRDKKNIRDKIRALPNGEIQWQALQAFIYGKGINGAELSKDVKPFLDACRNAAINVSIVSHKTQFAPMDEGQVNLIDAAMDWMRKNRFFDDEGLGLSPDKVYFESTRIKKIERIKKLGCTHFIDDLEETFLEESFPANVRKILYARKRSQLKDVITFCTWKEIYGYFFGK